MKPFIKWPGGKSDELNIILKNLPTEIEGYYEPFVGGGALYFGIYDLKHYYINDKSDELMSLYQSIKEQNQEFLYAIKEIDKCWRVLEEITEHYINEFVEIYKKYKDNEIYDAQLSGLVDDFIISKSDEFNGILNEKFIVEWEKDNKRVKSKCF